VKNLILVDGTWRKAKWILNHNPRLTKAPVQRVHCTVTREGQFKFRKEPRKGFVSTLEALCHALTQLDKSLESVSEALMKGFQRMVEIQLTFIPERKNKSDPKNANITTKQVDISIPSANRLLSSAETKKNTPSVTWGGGAEKEILALLKATPKALPYRITKDGKRGCDRTVVWALCETLLKIDGKWSYRELFRMNNVTHKTAIAVCKLANRNRARGSRLCTISVKCLKKTSPDSLNPNSAVPRNPTGMRGNKIQALKTTANTEY